MLSKDAFIDIVGHRLFPYALPLVVIGAILVPLLFFINFPQRTMYYVLALITAGLVTLLFRSTKPTIRVHIHFFIVDCAFLAMSFTLVLSEIIFHDTILNFVTSLIITFFLPGWTLSRLLKFDSFSKSICSKIVFSFITSILISSLLWLSTYAISQQFVNLYLSIVFFAIASLNILASIKWKGVIRSKPLEYNLIEISILFFIVIIFFIVIAELYPAMATLPGADIVRHYSSSKELIITPDLYDSNYPWFHFPFAVILSIAEPPIWLMQTGVSILSLMSFLSFYVMATAFLKKIDSRAPILATVTFFLFSGFGWLFMVGDSIMNEGFTEPIKQLSETNLASYWDTSFGESPWLWFWLRPITIGFTIVFYMISLVVNQELPKIRYLILVSICTVTLAQVHFPELLIIILLFLVISILRPPIRSRLYFVHIGIIIGLISSVALSLVYPEVLDSVSMPRSNINVLILIGISVISCAIMKYFKIRNIEMKIPFRLVLSILLFIYFVGLLTWFFNVDLSSISRVIQSLAVPWEFYPVLLGVAGMLAIPGSIIVLKKYQDATIFVILFLLAVAIGRIITLINVGFQDTGYWERRIIPFAYLSASVLASIFLTRALNFLTNLRNNWSSLIFPAVVGSIVLVGVFSTFISLQYQTINAQRNALSSIESQIQASMNTTDPRSVALTMSDRTRNVVEFGNVGYLIGYFKYQMWPAVYPEIPLRILSVLNGTSSIFLSKNDVESVSKLGYKDGYIFSHLIPSSKKSEDNQSDRDPIKISFRAPPIQSSSNVLVLPEKFDPQIYNIYDLLSLSGYNYTTALVSDIISLRNASLLIVPSEEIASQLMTHRADYGLGFKKIIVVNMKNYGNIATFRGSDEFQLEYSNSNISNWELRGFGAGTISGPSIDEDSLDGAKVLKISVGQGNYSLWELSRIFNDGVDISSYDAFKFDWFGRADDKWYVIEFVSDNSTIWYRFKDSWKGWKSVVLPIGRSYLSGNSFGTVFNRVADDSFNLSSVTRINLRTESSNGNQSGIFYVKDFLFLKNQHVDSIDSKDNITIINLPRPIIVNSIKLPNDFEADTFFGNSTIPFSLRKITGGYELIYLNMVPLANITNIDLSLAIGHFLDDTGLEINRYTSPINDVRRLVSDRAASFSQVNLGGETMIQSSAGFMKTHNSSITNTRDHAVFENITDIIPIYTDEIKVSGNKSVSDSGYGYYSKFLFNNSKINFAGQSYINLKNVTGDLITISGNDIELATDEIEVILRQPKITTSGVAKFMNFYAYGELAPKLRSLGQEFIVNGNISMTNELSDKDTLIKKMNIVGSHERIPPIYGYSDLANLMNIFSLLNIKHILALAVLILVLNVFVFRKI